MTNSSDCNSDKLQKSLHYTIGIEGCGHLLEKKIQDLVFKILRKITKVAENGKLDAEDSERLLLLTLQWKFTARDFSYLLD
jgi:hypothetical protein